MFSVWRASSLSFLVLSFFVALGASAHECRKLLVVVDAAHSGALILPEANRRGLDVIHFDSGEAPASWLPEYDLPGYLDKLTMSEGLDAIVERLIGLPNLIEIMPGSEAGVLPAARLTQALVARGANLPFDGVEEAWRNKAELAKLLADGGISGVPQTLASNMDEVYAFMAKHRLRANQLYLKAPASSGADGQAVPTSKKDLEEKFAKLQRQTDKYGHPIRQILVMLKLRGKEYVVNTVSKNGIHLVTDIWQYKRRKNPFGGAPLYDVDWMLPYDGEVQKRIIEFDKRVLTAARMNNGFGHSEVFDTPDYGPVECDLAKRMMGSRLPRLVSEATGGASQIEIGIEAADDSAAFFRRKEGYTLNKVPAVVTLSVWEDGVYLNPEIESMLRNLPGFQRFEPYSPRDALLNESRDLGSQLGHVEFLFPKEWLDKDPNLMWNTINKVRRMDRAKRFTVKRK